MKIVAVCLVVLILGLAGAGASTLVYSEAEVTTVLVIDSDLVITNDNVLLPCPQVKFPGCLDLEFGDDIKFYGHLAGPVGLCEDEIVNPIVADDIQICCGSGCYSLINPITNCH